MTDIDPIEPTKIAPGLTAIPLTPTVWDDLPDGQVAVTSNSGLVWQPQRALVHAPVVAGRGRRADHRGLREPRRLGLRPRLASPRRRGGL